MSDVIKNGRWRLVIRGNSVSVYVQSPEYGEVLTGILYLAEADITELVEMFRGDPA